MKERKPWERMPEESDKAWSAFCFFRDLPPKDRSISAAYRLYTGTTKTQKSTNPSPFFKKWAKFFKWAERSQAFDIAEDDRKLLESASIDRKIRIAARENLLRGIELQCEKMETEEVSFKDRTSWLNSLRETLKCFEFGELSNKHAIEDPLGEDEYGVVEQ